MIIISKQDSQLLYNESVHFAIGNSNYENNFEVFIVCKYVCISILCSLVQRDATNKS